MLLEHHHERDSTVVRENQPRFAVDLVPFDLEVGDYSVIASTPRSAQCSGAR